MPNEVKELFKKPFEEVTMQEAIVMFFCNKEEGFKRIDYIQKKEQKEKKNLKLNLSLNKE